MAESINVVCRVRPFNSSEIARGDKYCVTFPPDNKSAISLCGKTYVFDQVFGPQTTQIEIYEKAAKHIVSDVLQGYNGTIFAYGQTSSGKTYTMEGKLDDDVFQGIIPRIISDIFNHIYNMESNIEFHIKVCYLEIYLDKIRDLLDISRTNLSVHEDKDRVPFVKGASERFVLNPDEVFSIIDEGKSNRHVAVTNMNEHSSRSHSVFMIIVKQENLDIQKKLHGKLYLVDLAGSEKVAKTGAEGTVLDEARNINKSLSALGNVINALVENSAHVPYRDSKLTRILQESLGGNAKTTMVICCSPAMFNEAETKSTIMFGMRAKTIKNNVTINEELTADEWRRRYEQVKERNVKLTSLLNAAKAELERWRAGEKVDSTDWMSADIADSEETTSSTTNLQDSSAKSSTKTEQSPATPVNGSQAFAPSTPTVQRQIIQGSINEEQLQALYQQLDDKDDEINRNCQISSRLREQIEELESEMRTMKEERENQINEILRLERDCETSKEEAKEVLQALEELAMNFDQKESEISSKSKELEEVMDSLTVKETQLVEKENEFQSIKDSLGSQKKKYSEMFSSLFKEIVEVGAQLNDQIPKPTENLEKLDEEVTSMRLYIRKLKNEARSCQLKAKELEEEKSVHMALITKNDEESKLTRAKVQEYEAKIANLNDKLEETEIRRRNFLDTIDQLNSDLVRLRASEQLNISRQNGQNDAILQGQEAIQMKLDEELKRQTESHAAQVKELRDELANKEKELQTHIDRLNHLEVQSKSLTAELKSQTEELEKTKARVAELEVVDERKRQARSEIVAVQETVDKELTGLNEIKAELLATLQNRIAKMNSRSNIKKINLGENTMEASSTAPTSTTGGSGDQNSVQPDTTASIANATFEELSNDDDIETSGSVAQRTKISYLEANLMRLTKMHKALVATKGDLKLDLMKLEKRHKSAMDRITMLETALKEAKDSALKDRKRYNYEIERIREMMRVRAPVKRRAPQITIPIRAGNNQQHILSKG